MPTAIVVFLIVLALVAGITVTLRTRANQGIPPKEVLERARRRNEELEALEKKTGDE